MASKLAMAEQREWQRIAHVLHEHIQQSLYGTKMEMRRQVFLFQAARELLFNVAKHAQVEEARLRVGTEAG